MSNLRTGVERSFNARATLSGDSIHARLRCETAARHHALDQALRYLLAEDLSIERYGRLLAALLGFYAPLEQRLRALRSVTPPAPVPLLSRARLLQCDLRVLGVSRAPLPLCQDLPSLTQSTHLGGAWYVVEGACLGGQVIARAVERRLHLTRASGAAFFVGSGARTAARWRRVLEWLEQIADDDTAGNQIVAGACQTFDALTGWLYERRVAL